MNKFSIKEIVTIGILLGLHFTLNLPFFKIFVPICMGSISFKFFPFFLIALNFSFLKTLISIFFSSCFDWFLSGYPIYTLLFDYVVPYLSILLITIFKDKIFHEKKINFVNLICVVVAIFVIRLLSHSISGFLFYEVSFIAAVIYNAPCCFFNDLINLILFTLFLKYSQHNNEYGKNVINKVSKR